MMYLNFEDARLANLILILINTEIEPGKSVTQTMLIEALLKRRGRIDRMLDMLSKLQGWGLISRKTHKKLDPFLVGDCRHNVEYPSELATYYQLEVFADVSIPRLNAVSYPMYEIMVFQHNYFNDPDAWRNSISKLHGSFAHREIGARIIEKAVSLIATQMHQSLNRPHFIPVSSLIPCVQLELFPEYPLLSPLVIQAFVEHPFVRMCLTQEESERHPNEGMTEVVYRFTDVNKIPTREECREATKA